MAFFLLFAAWAGAPADAGRDIEIRPPAADTAAYEQAATLYVKGLEAWKMGNPERAWRLATEALILDPSLSAARLLAGYALLRMRRTDEGVATLAGLSLEPAASPLPAAARRTAARVSRQRSAPFRRDQWWLSVGNVTFIQRLGAGAAPVNGYVFAGQAPIVGALALRVDGGAPWPGADPLDIRGPQFDLLAVVEQPLGAGRWQVDVAAGPTFWIAQGRYWADGWEPYVGARAALGIDVRLGAAVGLRLETGASVFPTAADDLPFYARPLDITLAFQTFFGR